MNKLSPPVPKYQLQFIITQAKHLRKAGNRLLCYARKAANGETSAINLLQGRVSTDKVKKKLLLNLIPRLRSVEGGDLVRVSRIFKRRRGDNAPMVKVSIVGNEKT
jgi:ribosomal protein L17